jgi:hypothetical protein
MSDDRSSISGSDLRYPLYLDVPMMISFLASLQDGIAYDKTVNRKTARGRKRWGQAEAGLKLPPVTALLSFNAQGKLAREGKQDESEEEQVVRRHTEASFFNILYKALLDDGAVRNIDSLDQADWTELHSGELVQVTGEVFRNPLQQVVHFHENRPAPLRLKHQTDQQEDVGTNDESAKQADNDMAEMFQQLGQELRSASLQDLIFRPACKRLYDGAYLEASQWHRTRARRFPRIRKRCARKIDENDNEWRLY